MTVAFSAVSANLIVMTVDSAVTKYYSNGSREYDTGRKSYICQGVGCVTWWGARDCNNIVDFLNEQKVSANGHSINELVTRVNDYLNKEYEPSALNFNDVGYHVAGFDRDARPRLYHIYYGFEQPRDPKQIKREYRCRNHSPKNSEEISLLYNGRSDLAQVVINTIFNHIKCKKETRFDFKNPLDIVRFGDFVARFAAEITPEVGPPFFNHLISPSNEIAVIKHDTLSPIEPEKVKKSLVDLGYKA